MNKQSFCKGWTVAKEGGAPVAVELPHDAMILEDRSPDAKTGGASAYYMGGKYTYEKKFDVPADWEGKDIRLQFEGVYRNAVVSVNGKEVGGKPYGYIPFFCNISDALVYGGENTVTVIADNSEVPNSRWYCGSGIYRPVWLWVGEKTCIEPEGIKVSTISYSPAKIKVCTAHNGGEVSVEILDGETVVATANGDCVEIDVPDAKLWCDETPNLYRCKVTLTENGEKVDEAECNFGIRVIEWSPKGFFVNGKSVLLRGGCVHHDNGILGSRSYAKAEERRVRIHKEAGFNAIRSAHNPCAQATLDACDKLGVYMMDEAWDMWYKPKNPHDYSKWFMDNYEYDLKAIVDRDYSHPSVVMYSIGNEVSEPAHERGVEQAKKMVEILHSLDSTRPVTGGMNLMIMSGAAKGNDLYKDGENPAENQGGLNSMNSTMFNMMMSIVGPSMSKAANGKGVDKVCSPVLDALDIAGYNYASGRYPNEGKLHPDRVIVGSETMPYQIQENWEMVEKYPYLIGDFMWTSWDYLGEVGIGGWHYDKASATFTKPYPWKLADSGAFDILGDDNAEVGMAQAAWHTIGKPYIGVSPVNHANDTLYKAMWRGTNALPSWSWNGCDGNKATVEVYFDCAKIELLLDTGKKKAKSLGKKKVKKQCAKFKVKYVPGTLIAVAYDASGKEIARNSLSSATGKIALTVAPEETCVKAGEVVFVPVYFAGENGVWDRAIDKNVTVSVENGELLAFGSALPKCEESYNSGTYPTYYGRALAVVKASEAGGEVKVTATSEGETASAVIKAE